MDVGQTPVLSAEARTKIAYDNRWKTIRNNPKILFIAFFAS
jgi:hypothetical protein